MTKPESLLSRGERIHQMFEQPDAWIVETLPKFREVSQAVNISELKAQQVCRFIQETKMLPEDIHATIVLPIHNEATCLPSALGALMLSDIPDTCHIQFVFFVNGSTDKDQSKHVVEQFLRDIGEVTQFYSPVLDKNSDIISPSQYTAKNNLEFVLIESARASKTHAITIANELAFQRKDAVTISVDANNWLDPQALRSIIATTYASIDENKAFVIGGRSIYSYRPSFFMNLKQRSEKVFERSENLESKDLHGWLMAWDTTWLHSIGGLPEVACDDYALSLETRESGKQVVFDQQARIWGYLPNSYLEYIRIHARMIRDRIQIREYYSHDSSITEILKDDEYFMGSITQRINHFFEEIKAEPSKFPVLFYRAVRWEIVRLYGAFLYSRNPKSQTWSSIISTK